MFKVSDYRLSFEIDFIDVLFCFDDILMKYNSLLRINYFVKLNVIGK